MLALENRLTKDKDFKRVERSGTLTQSVSFGLAVLDRRDTEPTRFGFVISKKVAANASQRVRAKRALSEAMRQNMYAVRDGFDCVFLAKQIIVKKYTTELMEEVRDTLKRAKLLK